jgi:transcriptional regulator with XRE-family HTH domain
MIDGDAIKAAREAAQLRQDDVADRMGVTDVTVWRWESGRTKSLDYPTARRLAEVLGVPLDDLFTHAPEADRASTGHGKTDGDRTAASTRSPAPVHSTGA